MASTTGSASDKRPAVDALAPLGGGPRALGGGKSDAALGREQSSAKRQRLSAPQPQPPTPSMASIGRLSELVATLGELKAGLSTVSAAIEAAVSVFLTRFRSVVLTPSHHRCSCGASARCGGLGAWAGALQVAQARPPPRFPSTTFPTLMAPGRRDDNLHGLCRRPARDNRSSTTVPTGGLGRHGGRRKQC